MKSISQQGQFWDTARDQTQPVIEARRLIDSLLPLDLIKEHDVLDVGCGAGHYGVAFAAAGARSVTGFDVSAGSLHIALKRNKAARFSQASLSELPFRDASFDVLWAWGMLHYVPDGRAALGEIARVLRPGGLAVIHTLRTSFWATLELSSARVLCHTPGWLQPPILSAGERLVPLVSRLVTGHRPEDQTAKTVRQKLHERLFAPGRLTTYTLDTLAKGLGASIEAAEAYPPVSDLLKRDMSITVVARKRGAVGSTSS